MRPSTLFVATFSIWLIAKGKAPKYWKLATTSDVGGVSSSAPNGASAGAKVSSLSGASADLQAKGDSLMKYYAGSA